MGGQWVCLWGGRLSLRAGPVLRHLADRVEAGPESWMGQQHPIGAALSKRPLQWAAVVLPSIREPLRVGRGSW